MIEVKSSFSDSKKANAEYVDDLAYTVMVLRRVGFAVRGAGLLLLSRRYRRGDPVDALFAFVDKTEGVNARTERFDNDADAIAARGTLESRAEPRTQPRVQKLRLLQNRLPRLKPRAHGA